MIFTIKDLVARLSEIAAQHGAAWVRDTCLLFGTSVETAYRVAALFMEALRNEQP